MLKNESRLNLINKEWSGAAVASGNEGSLDAVKAAPVQDPLDKNVSLQIGTTEAIICKKYIFLIAAVSLSNDYYLGALHFTIQRIWIAVERCLFFKICSHIFMIFEVKLEQWFWLRRNRNWSKKRVALRSKFFLL